MIKLHFTRGQGIVPAIIRWITWSDANHVAIEVHGYVYESNHRDGVFKTPAVLWRHNKEILNTIDLPALNAETVENRLKAEVGKKYDWLNLFCYPLRCDYQHKNRWTCSELIAYAIQELIPHKHFHRVAPRHLLGIAHANNYQG